MVATFQLEQGGQAARPGRGSMVRDPQVPGMGRAAPGVTGDPPPGAQSPPAHPTVDRAHPTFETVAATRRCRGSEGHPGSAAR